MSRAGRDFREQAARESVRLVGAELLVPPLDLGLSLCHPCPDPPSPLRPAVYLVGGLVLGFAGLIAGALIATQSGSNPGPNSPDDWPLLILAGCCTLLGFVSLFAGIFLSRGWVRRQLGERGRPVSLPDGTEARPHQVGIEDAATFEKLKLQPEDQGHLYFDNERHALLIEGLLHRYTVFDEDVAEVAQVAGGNTRGIRITYCVGEAVLSLVISQGDNLKQELKSQLGGAKTAPLLTEVRTALRTDDAEPV